MGLLTQKMGWLLKAFGYQGREYRGDGFRVRIDPVVREAVSVIYTHHGTKLKLGGERIGKKWEGISVQIPQEIDGERLAQIVVHLEIAFRSLGRGYVISRLGAVEIVDETERQAAIAELREMGYEVEVSADRRQIRQKPIEGTARQDKEALRRLAPRMAYLIQAIHGKRQTFQVLAKSNGV